MRSRPRCTSSPVRPCVAPRSMESDWRKRASDASSSERTKSSPGCTSGTAERRPALARTTRRSASRTTTKSGQRSMTSDARLSATSPLRLSVYPRRGHRFKRVFARLQPRSSDGSVERKRILVTGAGGLIGSHLCEAFAAAGWEGRALDREGTDCAEARAAGAGVVHADLERPEGALFAAGQARDATLVAHAAFPGAGEVEAALAGVRAAAAAALSAQAALLLLSSCAVYGRPRNLPCDEGELKAPVDAHGEARWAVEREAFLLRRTRGLRLVVLRPALTYGPRQRRGLAAALGVAARAARAGRGVWLPRRGPVVHLVHAADVAQAALLLAEHGASELDGKAFNVADDVPLPMEELARAVLAAAGAREAGRLPYSPAPAGPVL